MAEERKIREKDKRDRRKKKIKEGKKEKASVKKKLGFNF